MIKINQLTFTRFIAAMLVFIYHYGRGTFFIPNGADSGLGYFFLKGNVSVSFFYVLSGFILYLVYNSKIKTKENIRFFYKARLIRIMPAYCFALFIYVFSIIYFYGYPIHVKDFLLSLFLVQSWVPNYELVLNTPGWSLSVEAFFYMIFPFIIFFTRNVNRQVLISVFVVLFIISQGVHISLEGHTAVESIRYYNPLLHLGTFLMGIVFGIIYAEKILAVFIERYSGLIMAIMMIIFIISLSFAGFVRLNYHNGLFAPVFGFFILALALNTSWITKLFSLKPFVFLGDISYGFYIYQFPSYFIASYISDKLNLQISVHSFSYLLLILIILSSISYLFLERPLRMLVMAKQPVKIRKFFSYN